MEVKDQRGMGAAEDQEDIIKENAKEKEKQQILFADVSRG